MGIKFLAWNKNYIYCLQNTNVYIFRPSWSSSTDNHHIFITKPKPQLHLRPQYTPPSSTFIIPTDTPSPTTTTDTTPTTTTTPDPTTTASTTTTTHALLRPPSPPRPPPLPRPPPSSRPPPQIITSTTTTTKPLVIVTTTSSEEVPTMVPGKPEKHTAKPGVSADTNQKSTRTYSDSNSLYEITRSQKSNPIHRPFMLLQIL